LDKLHEENKFYREHYERYKDEAEKVTSIINVSNTGTWEWNIKTGETVFNENWARILGYTLDELQPISIKTWQRLAHPEDYKHFEIIFNQYMMNGEIDHYKAEVRMKHKQGHWVWVLDQGEIIQYDKNGEPLWLGGTHQDITPQKEAQFQAEKAKRLYAVISQVNQAIVHTNDVNLLLDKVCNIAIDYGKFRMAWIGLFNEAQTNFETHSFAGNSTEHDDVAQNEEKKQPFLCEFAAQCVFKGEKYICNNLESAKCNKARKKRALEFGYQSSIALPIVMLNQTIGVFALYSEHSAYFNNDEIKLLEEVVYDLGFALEVIEQQKEHQKVISELKYSEERFRMLADSAPAGIAIASYNGDILYLSPRFTEITGYTIDDIPTLDDWWPLAYPDAGYRKLMVEKWDKAVNISLEATFSVKKVENKVSCKNGRVKDIEFRVASKGENNYVIITDITERVEAEHKANERLKELNAFYRLGELTELKNIDRYELFSRFIDTLPESLQYPDIAYGRIVFNDYDFKTENYFENGKWVLKSPVIIDGEKSGFVEVGYTSEKPDVYEGPFLKEERQLIAGLAERIGRIVERLKAEKGLLYQIRFQKMVAEISSDFIRVNDNNIDEKIRSMLERLGHFFNVDRTYLFLFEDGYNIINYTHEWCCPGTEPLIETMQNFRTDNIPWWKEQILEGKSINIPDISALPAKAKNEQKMFQEQHIQSLLSVPVITHERIIGFFGFDAVKNKTTWSEMQVDFLKILANILADAHVKVGSEVRIKESEAQHRLMFETAQEGIVIAQDYRLVYFNPKIEDFTGYSSQELQDMEFLKIVHPGDRNMLVNRYKKRLQGEHVDQQYEFRMLTKDGSVRWVTMSGVQLMWNGRPATFNFLNDVTRQKETLEKLKDLNATKDKFFSIISHDLKSPFNSILGMSDLLVESAGEMDVKSLQRYAKVIRDSSERAMGLLTNLLDWSRAQTGRMAYHPEKIDVSTIVSETASLLYENARQKSVSLVNHIPYRTFVQADKKMLSTVFRNLMSNAIKFSYSGGKVTISSALQKGKTVISVSDEGIGIQPETANKLFRIDENVTTNGTNNEKGTGLGLILCKELVEKHGGQIWVESEEGKGSTFYFTIAKE
jgi:PAS domain S-box-containing protein